MLYCFLRQHLTYKEIKRFFMAPLTIYDYDFCAGETFKKQIIEILYKYLFKKTTNLETIYDEMTRNINVNTNNKKIIKLYQRDGTCLNDNLDTQSIQRNGSVYAGHDLPVWRNNPDNAKIKIMVITQDPRRSEVEMEGNKMPNSKIISISTPFGLHSQTYRSHKTRGLVHYLFKDLQKELADKYKYKPNELSIYYTDFYKFRGVAPNENSNAPKDVKDNCNIMRYVEVLRCEIEAYNPNVILLMGNDAQRAWNVISKKISTNIKPLCTPHPSPNANRKWKERYPEISSFTAENKRKLIIGELLANFCME